MRFLATALFALSLISSSKGKTMEIVTIYNDPSQALSTPAEKIKMDKKGLVEARAIANHLIQTLKPLMPAAGLAAPQIGIKKQVFIYSWDRTSDHMEVAINPSFEAVDDASTNGWEACFSTAPDHGPCQAAHLPRYNKIKVHYTNLDGAPVSLVLEGFAAKVFQHEYDHLQGIVNVTHDTIETRDFEDKNDFITFMTSVKQKDSASYIAPKKA